MSASLISRSPDLQKLRDAGYEVSIVSGHLVVDNIPYVNAQKQVRRGRLVSDLALAGDVTTKPKHLVYFNGEQPCHKDGTEIAQIKHQVADQLMADGLEVNRSFSNKPKGGYPDYYEKMTTYAAILSGPAESLDPLVSPRTFRPVAVSSEDDCVFNYLDTASSRAGITRAAAKLEGHRIAIVGLGGSGSYVLDLVAKCPVSAIHLFDGDDFLQHNAFRSPGAPSIDQLAARENKATRFARIYSAMHRGIVPHAYHIDADTAAELADFDFVFCCVDNGRTRRLLVEELEKNDQPFVDVGLGANLVEDRVGGILRVTTSTPGDRDHIRERVSMGETTNEADDYSTNIQIADLNSLTAALAVIRWKKLCGFYRDFEEERSTTYTIDVNMVLNDVRCQ